MSDGRMADGVRVDREPPPFAHASEAELARILDFYEVRWAYEPHVYPIMWSIDGDVLESFAPDFYLPELDLYVELTTLRQKLVRKKNRKLRRLRELYPDIRIKLFYARDFRMLMLKYGKLAIVDELSGAVGQVVPARLAELPAAGRIQGQVAASTPPEQPTLPDQSTPPDRPETPASSAGRSGSAVSVGVPDAAAPAVSGSSPSPRTRRKREAASR